MCFKHTFAKLCFSTLVWYLKSFVHVFRVGLFLPDYFVVVLGQHLSSTAFNEYYLNKDELCCRRIQGCIQPHLFCFFSYWITTADGIDSSNSGHICCLLFVFNCLWMLVKDENKIQQLSFWMQNQFILIIPFYASLFIGKLLGKEKILKISRFLLSPRSSQSLRSVSPGDL